MPLKTAVEANWAVISHCAPKLDAQVAVRHRADIAAAEEALASAEALAANRKATAADAQAAAGQGTARARETLQRVRAEGVKRRREEAAVEPRWAATTRPAPGATSPTGSSSAQQDAPPLFSAPSTTLDARLGPIPGSPTAQVPVTGHSRRPQDRAFLQGSAACMARSARGIFALDEAMAVLQSAQALLLELPEERLVSVDAAWRLVQADTWEGQRLSEVVTGLVASLRTDHDHCSSVVIWPTTEED